MNFSRPQFPPLSMKMLIILPSPWVAVKALHLVLAITNRDLLTDRLRHFLSPLKGPQHLHANLYNVAPNCNSSVEIFAWCCLKKKRCKDGCFKIVKVVHVIIGSTEKIEK